MRWKSWVSIEKLFEFTQQSTKACGKEMTDFVSPVVSSTQSFFREEALVVELLTQCSQIVQGDTATPTPTAPHNHHPEFLKIAQDARKCIDIIETYQEQPAILDASLEVMVAPIMVGFRQAVAQHTARVAADWHWTII